MADPAGGLATAAATSAVARDTADYEAWMASYFRPWADDLTAKHVDMASGPFSFLRATFYRWARLLPATCPDLMEAPRVTAVGDLHVENFGTWRDLEGRLVWGVNDFDEATALPYTADLLRLAVSARLTIMAGHLDIAFADACRAILAGYREAISSGGHPLVLAEDDRWLRQIALSKLRDPVRFWARMAELPQPPGRVAPEVSMVLANALPEGSTGLDLRRRRAGLGSLGRPRYVALAHWNGALVAREAKAVLPSAWDWVHGNPLDASIGIRLAFDGVRDPDPAMHLREPWMVRRLAPDCSRIELDLLPAELDEERLLRAMGFETGNLHLGSGVTAGAAILDDLERRPRRWLRAGAREMVEATMVDWRDWRRVAAVQPA
ncbi:MAG: DUF2252 family protein [Candidatus Dormibacteria bacterium]